MAASGLDLGMLGGYTLTVLMTIWNRHDVGNRLNAMRGLTWSRRLALAVARVVYRGHQAMTALMRAVIRWLVNER